jgi:hypothetical protein
MQNLVSVRALFRSIINNKNMVKNYFSKITVIVIAILAFTLGMAANKVINSAAISNSFSQDGTTSIHTCVNQKCVAVSKQCSADNECITHMECNDKKQCVSVSGTGTNKCSADIDCDPTKDPQKWCETNNSGEGLYVNVTKYPNGNFSCSCYIKVSSSITQVPCRNSHLQ